MPEFTIRPLDETDAHWVSQFIAAQWGAEIVVARGTTYRPAMLPGFVALQKGEKAGLITYHIEGNSCEIVSLDSLHLAQGIGSALIEAVKEVARKARCRRLWLITTNDNLHALGFYQKRGFALVAVHRNAVDATRKIKPEIPAIGADGIPLRDEIELEMLLDDPPPSSGDEAGQANRNNRNG